MATLLKPVRMGDAALQRAKMPFGETRPSSTRPLSLASDVLDTDFEDDSDFEDYSPKASFETVCTAIGDTFEATR